MKQGVVIINTARGPIIDEQALVDALESGKVWSCGLDVYENEPAVHPGLVAHPRAMLLPHLGTYTVEVSLISLLTGCWMSCSLQARRMQRWRRGVSRMCGLRWKRARLTIWCLSS